MVFCDSWWLFVEMDSNAIPGELTLGVFLIGLSLLFDQEKPGHQAQKKKTIDHWWHPIRLCCWPLGNWQGPFGDLPWQHSISKKCFLLPLQPLSILWSISRNCCLLSQQFTYRHDLKYVPFLLVIGIVGTYLGKKFWIGFRRKNLNPFFDPDFGHRYFHTPKAWYTKIKLLPGGRFLLI